MKRIDEKLVEIKKSQRKYRVLFVLFVILLFVFMGVVFKYEDKLDKQRIMLSDTYKELKSSKDSLNQSKEELEASYENLKNSLRPNEYWEAIKKENSVESYIDYITNDWGIQKPNLNQALSDINNGNVLGYEGWLYIGKMVDNNFSDHRSSVVWRKSATDKLGLVLPQIGDVVQQRQRTNLKTYKKSNLNRKNTEGWRPGTKAYVADVEKVRNEIRIKIRYY